MTASKRRDGRDFLMATNLYSPQNLQGPGSASKQPYDAAYLQGQAYSYRLDVIHPDIPHPDPRVIDQGKKSNGCRQLEPGLRKQSRPALVMRDVSEQEGNQQN